MKDLLPTIIALVIGLIIAGAFGFALISQDRENYRDRAAQRERFYQSCLLENPLYECDLLWAKTGRSF